MEESQLGESEHSRFVLNVEELTFGPLINRGSFGEVFEGKYKGKDVAIKKLRIADYELASDSTEKKDPMVYINREIDFLCSFSHKHIITFIGSAIDTEVRYFTLIKVNWF